MVYENEDELGYWTYPRGAPSSLEVCDALLSQQDQVNITLAASLAYQGNGFAAEDVRRCVDYHDIHHRDDADSVETR